MSLQKFPPTAEDSESLSVLGSDGLTVLVSPSKAQIQALRNELENEKNEYRQELKNEENEFRQGLERERAERKEDIEALRSMIGLITPIHLLILLDLARGKILECLGFNTWEALCAGNNIHQQMKIIHQGLTDIPNCPSHDAIDLLCSFNGIQCTSNTIAHSASREEVKAAIMTEQFEPHCDHLEQLFKFSYGE